MNKTALYLRLSKEDEDKLNKGDDSDSIINQRLLLTDYAISHDFQIEDVYSDDDYSGLYDDRPGFDRLIQDAKLGKFNIVIAKSQSRFTRNMEHVEKYLHHDFPLMGVRFIGVVDGVDTQDASNKKSRQINGLVNEWYCEDLSNNIRAVFHQKMKDGKFLGGFAPYGYLKDPKDKYKFIIDEEAAGVVRRIYSLFMEGYAIWAIGHILEDDGILNPTLYKKSIGLNFENAKSVDFSQKYNLWSTTTVKRILSNEVYTGTLIQGMNKKVSYKDKKVVAVPKDQWYITPNHHEAIIDIDTFNAVKSIRSKRRICAENQGQGKQVHVFAGKLRCATCGHTMIKSGGVKKNQSDRFMKCQLANKSRGKECTPHTIKYSTIENTVLERIRELSECVLNDKKNISSLISVMSCNDSKERIESNLKEIGKIDSKIKSITNSVKTLYVDRTNEMIDNDMFFQLKEEFEKELKEEKERKKKLELENEKESLKNDKLESVEEIVRRHADIKKLTHGIVNDFIDFIEISEKNQDTNEQNIIIHWNF